MIVEVFCEMDAAKERLRLMRMNRIAQVAVNDKGGVFRRPHVVTVHIFEGSREQPHHGDGLNRVTEIDSAAVFGFASIREELHKQFRKK
ncbi:MAG: hypothetical protein QM811_17415 [Pirellulales bacterium]